MKRFLLALGMALGISLLSYLVMNFPYPLFDDWGTLAFAEMISGNRHKAPFPEDSVLCVNMAFDKQLAIASTPDNITRGTLDVTDRAKLIRLLKIAQRADYRYIFLDVRFTAGLKTENDDELFSLIREMPRLVFSHHRGEKFKIADSTLLDKAALADYGMTSFTGFTRYQYLQKGKESVALRMHRDLDHGDIRRHGPFYVSYMSEKRLCRNAQYIRIPRAILEREMGNNQIRYPYLGNQLFREYSDDELIEEMNGRILIIGDFDNDLHSTYVGDVPGAMLSFLAWWELHTGKHILSNVFLILMFALYTLISWLLLTPKDKLYEKIPFLKRIKNPVFRFLLSLFSWGLVFWVLQVLLYCFSEISLSIAVPSALFSIFAEFNKFKEKTSTK